MQVFTCPSGQINFKEVSDMGSDNNIKPKAEFLKNEDCGGRLYAYSAALSGKDRGALVSTGTRVKGGTGISGLMNELEKTKLDV